MKSQEPGRCLNQQKFGFDSVEWTLKLHGEAKADAKVGKVTFRQTQHHVWKLQSFESSSRRMFENDQFRTPIPVR